MYAIRSYYDSPVLSNDSRINSQIIFTISYDLKIALSNQANHITGIKIGVSYIICNIKTGTTSTNNISCCNSDTTSINCTFNPSIIFHKNYPFLRNIVSFPSISIIFYLT